MDAAHSFLTRFGGVTLLTLFLFQCTSFTVTNVSGQGCDLAGIFRHVKVFQKYLKDDTMSAPFDISELENICSEIKTALVNIEDGLKKCGGNIYGTFGGIITVVQNITGKLCSPRRSQDVLFQLFGCMALMSEPSRCESHYKETGNFLREILKDKSFLNADLKTIRKICRLYYDSKDCFTSETTEICGEELSENLTDYVETMLGPHISKWCPKRLEAAEKRNGDNAGTSSSPSFSVLAAVLAGAFLLLPFTR